MAAPFSLENTLRRHDEAVYGWFGGLLVDYGTVAGTARNQVGILRVLAAPDRAWARVVDTLVSQNWIAGATAAIQRENVENDHDVLPLPFLSIERMDPQPYFEGGGVPKRFGRQNFLGSTQQWEAHPWPGSYRTEYRATAWTSKKYTMAWIQEWVMSQLGLIGAAENEVFLDVVHAVPWGTIKQALRFDSMTDLSNLEGEEPRYLRSEFAFTLNTLHFRPPSGTAETIDTIVVAAAFESEISASLVAVEDLTGVDLAPATASGNLFIPYYPPPLIPTHWPKAGAAVVANSSVTPNDQPERSALRIEVDDPADQVDLVNRPIELDGQSHAVLSYSFQYLADAAVSLDVQQHDGSDMVTPVWTRMALETLPPAATWTRVHGFTIVTQPIFDVAVIGTGVPAVMRVAQVRVRHIHSGTKAAPTSTSVVSGNNRHVWTGLTADPYLVAVVFTNAPAIGTVVIENDQTTPDYTKSDAVDTAEQLSAVFLVQPKTTSLVLLVPVALTIAAVYLQRYDGAYGGHDL